MPIAFIAGSTGYTGQRVVAELRAPGSTWTARPHARAAGRIDGAVICDPGDVALLTEGVRGCDAVVQLIGTVRKNFDQGDYEKIDYGTTVALGEAARAAGVPRLLLLSSALAGTGLGSYLAWKKKTEDWVIASGLEYTIMRPSFIVGPGREAARTTSKLFGWSARFRGIDVADLARVFVRALERREEVKNKILEGNSLWQLIAEG
jgi:uncharacterized protein YbjT (DUF2867 family)